MHDTESRGLAMAPFEALVREELAPPPGAPSTLAEVEPPVAGSRRPDAGLSTIAEAVAALNAGEVVVVVDDHERENEGDFVMAADRVSAAAVNFMITHGRGLLCMPVAPERLDRLGIGPMVPDAAGHEETAFTVSIDLDVAGSTGISAHDRARTIRHVLDPLAHAEDFRRPGHVFPLRARAGGVLEREGHTEAAVDLARLAGLTPAGVICEIINPDGTMARLPDLIELAERWNLHLVTIADLVEARRSLEPVVEGPRSRRRTRTRPRVVRRSDARVPTPAGPFRAVAYEDTREGVEHLAFVHGDIAGSREVLVRLHSECVTGDVFGSQRCDCGTQLQQAMHAIAEVGRGVVVYLRGHEGRGIGMVEKLRAYQLQDAGHDTVEANVELGHPVDGRDYTVGAHILRDLGVQGVRLLTNNPGKRTALEQHGIDVTERVPLEVLPTAHNLHYLRTKRDKLGHVLSLEPARPEETL